MLSGASKPEQLVQGRGRFVADIRRDDAVSLAFVRSPYASGDVVSVDTDAARAMPGVIAVLDAGDLPAAMPGVNVFDHAPSLPERTPMAAKQVYWPGQALAIVVAESAEQAMLAAEAVEFDIDPKPAAHERVMHWRIQSGGAEDTALQRVSVKVDQARLCAMAIEPRAVLARFADRASGGIDGSRNDPEPGHLEVWLASQSPARARDEIAAFLAIDPTRVHVRVPDVGGAFGGKASLSPDELLVVATAWRLQRAVYWQATRSEEFLVGVHGRGGRWQAELSFSADGDLHGLNARLNFSVGGWLPYSALVPARNAARILPGPYRLRTTDVHTEAHSEALAAVNIYRGAGRPEAALIMEQLLDDAARALRIDPLALRLQNLVTGDQMPWRLPAGDQLDSGDPAALLRLAAGQFDYERERDDVARRREAGEHVGIGIACYVEPCGQGFERARITMTKEGDVMAALGTASQGQRHDRVFANLLACELAVDANRVQIIEGDTTECPDGIGALASRSMAIGGSALVSAARMLMARKRRGEPLPISVEAHFDAPAEAIGLGAVIARVRLDADTMAPAIERIVWADDCGQILDEAGVRAQQIGGMAQGIGQAMSEALRYDESGQLLSGSLMDYAVPRADSMPGSIQLIAEPSVTTANLVGAKGIGEAGCIGVPAALLNAVRDALACGEPIATDVDLSMPLTGARIWAAAQAMQRNESAQQIGAP